MDRRSLGFVASFGAVVGAATGVYLARQGFPVLFSHEATSAVPLEARVLQYGAAGGTIGAALGVYTTLLGKYLRQRPPSATQK